MELEEIRFVATRKISIRAKDYSNPRITGVDFLPGDMIRGRSADGGITYSIYLEGPPGRVSTWGATGSGEPWRALVVEGAAIPRVIKLLKYASRPAGSKVIPPSQTVFLSRSQALAAELDY